MPNPQLVDAAAHFQGNGLKVSFALDSVPAADLGPWLLAITLDGRGCPLRRLGILGDGQMLNLCFAHDLVDDVALLVENARVTRAGSVFIIDFPMSIIGADIPRTWSASFLAQSPGDRSTLAGAVS